jgi:hypothetical protein
MVLQEYVFGSFEQLIIPDFLFFWFIAIMRTCTREEPVFAG